MNLKNNKGVTLTTLIITIVVLLILASITAYGGSNLIKRANVENLKTNMLLIQAEAKSVVEEVNFKENSLDKSASDYTSKLEEIKQQNLIGTVLNDGLKQKMQTVLQNTGITEEVSSVIDNCYYLTSDNLNRMNIKTDSDNINYVIKYDFDNLTAEVYLVDGFNYKDNIYYSLSQLNEIKD